MAASWKVDGFQRCTSPTYMDALLLFLDQINDASEEVTKAKDEIKQEMGLIRAYSFHATLKEE
eukprot:123474-Prorocentrum_lima.AAC.1